MADSNLQERIQIIQDATSFKKTSRIPTYSNYWTYMVLDAGHKLGDALYDYGMLFEAVIGFHEKYNFDMYNYTGGRNPFRVTDLFEANRYIIDDERGAFNIQDNEIMYEGEYEELAKDPLKFIWSVIVPRKGQLMSAPESFDIFEKAVKEYDLYNQFTASTTKTLLEEHGVPQKAPTALRAPFDNFFNHLRGMKETAIDMRRDPQGLDAGIKALHEYFGIDAQVENFRNSPLPSHCVFGANSVLLGHSICSPKQFGAYYWPYLKEWFGICAETGKQFFLFTEAQVTSFADYFRDVPKGVLMLQPEQDDLIEFRRLVPDVALCGGMTTVTLGYKSKQEALDMAKMFADELGADGGFFMGQNKMMTYKNDAKPENILAVQEFCANYKP
ncbi:MAG: hypothetical protein FWG10_00950 [Eubacteriaceae bacterium]|nr:hypothetical protein [Eubacteriaceae bacterium]